MTGKFLIVDDEKSLRFTFTNFLKEEGYEVQSAETYEEALEIATTEEVDVIFADILLGNKTGIELLEEFKAHNVTCPVIMMTGFPNLETATEAVRLGAYAYFPKPIIKKELLLAARSALKFSLINQQNEKYKKNLEAIFRSIQDGIITLDKNGKILQFNEAAQTLCELPEHSVGEDFVSLPLPFSVKCRQILADFTNQKSPSKTPHTHRLILEQPEKIVNLTLSPLLDEKESIWGTLLVFRDETRINKLERRLRQKTKFNKMIGASPQMQEVYSLIEDLAEVDSNVIVLGESGTGKELVAEALHQMGPRKNKPLVKVNCAGFSDDLLDSELFGHVRGAFTGAIKDSVGRFKKAEGGTIFLDEIGDISERMQKRLLRVLQEKEFERVGDSTPIKADVRVVTATNQNLAEKVRCGEFREDLYYRLKVVTVDMPPLRKRKKDIPLLAEHFLQELRNHMGKESTVLSEEALEILVNHSWPGNVRELRHALEHALIRCKGEVIYPEALPPDILATSISSGDEKEAICKALAKAAGNKSKAASFLGIDRKTLYRKIKRYGITTD